MKHYCLKITSTVVLCAFIITNIGFAAPIESSSNELDFLRAGTARRRQTAGRIARALEGDRGLQLIRHDITSVPVVDIAGLPAAPSFQLINRPSRFAEDWQELDFSVQVDNIPGVGNVAFTTDFTHMKFLRVKGRLSNQTNPVVDESVYKQEADGWHRLTEVGARYIAADSTPGGDIQDAIGQHRQTRFAEVSQQVDQLVEKAIAMQTSAKYEHELGGIVDGLRDLKRTDAGAVIKRLITHFSNDSRDGEMRSRIGELLRQVIEPANARVIDGHYIARLRECLRSNSPLVRLAAAQIVQAAHLTALASDVHTASAMQRVAEPTPPSSPAGKAYIRFAADQMKSIVAALQGGGSSRFAEASGDTGKTELGVKISLEPTGNLRSNSFAAKNMPAIEAALRKSIQTELVPRLRQSPERTDINTKVHLAFGFRTLPVDFTIREAGVAEVRVGTRRKWLATGPVVNSTVFLGGTVVMPEILLGERVKALKSLGEKRAPTIFPGLTNIALWISENYSDDILTNPDRSEELASLLETIYTNVDIQVEVLAHYIDTVYGRRDSYEDVMVMPLMDLTGPSYGVAAANGLPINIVRNLNNGTMIKQESVGDAPESQRRFAAHNGVVQGYEREALEFLKTAVVPQIEHFPNAEFQAEVLMELKKRYPGIKVVATVPGPFTLARKVFEVTVLMAFEDDGYKRMIDYSRKAAQSFVDSLVAATGNELDGICVLAPEYSPGYGSTFLKEAAAQLKIFVEYLNEEHGVLAMVHACGLVGRKADTGGYLLPQDEELALLLSSGAQVYTLSAGIDMAKAEGLLPPDQQGSTAFFTSTQTQGDAWYGRKPSAVYNLAMASAVAEEPEFLIPCPVCELQVVLQKGTKIIDVGATKEAFEALTRGFKVGQQHYLRDHQSRFAEDKRVTILTERLAKGLKSIPEAARPTVTAQIAHGLISDVNALIRMKVYEDAEHKHDFYAEAARKVVAACAKAKVTVKADTYEQQAKVVNALLYFAIPEEHRHIFKERLITELGGAKQRAEAICRRSAPELVRFSYAASFGIPDFDRARDELITALGASIKEDSKSKHPRTGPDGKLEVDLDFLFDTQAQAKKIVDELEATIKATKTSQFEGLVIEADTATPTPAPKPKEEKEKPAPTEVRQPATAPTAKPTLQPEPGTQDAPERDWTREYERIDERARVVVQPILFGGKGVLGVDEFGELDSDTQKLLLSLMKQLLTVANPNITPALTNLFSTAGVTANVTETAQAISEAFQPLRDDGTVHAGAWNTRPSKARFAEEACRADKDGLIGWVSAKVDSDHGEHREITTIQSNTGATCWKDADGKWFTHADGEVDEGTPQPVINASSFLRGVLPDEGTFIVNVSENGKTLNIDRIVVLAQSVERFDVGRNVISLILPGGKAKNAVKIFVENASHVDKGADQQVSGPVLKVEKASGSWQFVNGTLIQKSDDILGLLKDDNPYRIELHDTALHIISLAARFAEDGNVTLRFPEGARLGKTIGRFRWGISLEEADRRKIRETVNALGGKVVSDDKDVFPLSSLLAMIATGRDAVLTIGDFQLRVYPSGDFNVIGTIGNRGDASNVTRSVARGKFKILTVRSGSKATTRFAEKTLRLNRAADELGVSRGLTASLANIAGIDWHGGITDANLPDLGEILEGQVKTIMQQAVVDVIPFVDDARVLEEWDYHTKLSDFGILHPKQRAQTKQGLDARFGVKIGRISSADTLSEIAAIIVRLQQARFAEEMGKQLRGAILKVARENGGNFISCSFSYMDELAMVYPGGNPIVTVPDVSPELAEKLFRPRIDVDSITIVDALKLCDHTHRAEFSALIDGFDESTIEMLEDEEAKAVIAKEDSPNVGMIYVEETGIPVTTLIIAPLDHLQQEHGVTETITIEQVSLGRFAEKQRNASPIVKRQEAWRQAAIRQRQRTLRKQRREAASEKEGNEQDSANRFAEGPYQGTYVLLTLIEDPRAHLIELGIDSADVDPFVPVVSVWSKMPYLRTLHSAIAVAERQTGYSAVLNLLVLNGLNLEKVMDVRLSDGNSSLGFHSSTGAQISQVSLPESRTTISVETEQALTKRVDGGDDWFAVAYRDLRPEVARVQEDEWPAEDFIKKVDLSEEQHAVLDEIARHIFEIISRENFKHDNSAWAVTQPNGVSNYTFEDILTRLGCGLFFTGAGEARKLTGRIKKKLAEECRVCADASQVKEMLIWDLEPDSRKPTFLTAAQEEATEEEPAAPVLSEEAALFVEIALEEGETMPAKDLSAGDMAILKADDRFTFNDDEGAFIPKSARFAEAQHEEVIRTVKASCKEILPDVKALLDVIKELSNITDPEDPELSQITERIKEKAGDVNEKAMVNITGPTSLENLGLTLPQRHLFQEPINHPLTIIIPGASFLKYDLKTTAAEMLKEAERMYYYIFKLANMDITKVPPAREGGYMESGEFYILCSSALVDVRLTSYQMPTEGLRYGHAARMIAERTSEGGDWADATFVGRQKATPKSKVPPKPVTIMTKSDDEWECDSLEGTIRQRLAEAGMERSLTVNKQGTDIWINNVVPARFAETTAWEQALIDLSEILYTDTEEQRKIAERFERISISPLLVGIDEDTSTFYEKVLGQLVWVRNSSWREGFAFIAKITGLTAASVGSDELCLDVESISPDGVGSNRTWSIEIADIVSRGACYIIDTQSPAGQETPPGPPAGDTFKDVDEAMAAIKETLTEALEELDRIGFIGARLRTETDGAITPSYGQNEPDQAILTVTRRLALLHNKLLQGQSASEIGPDIIKVVKEWLATQPGREYPQIIKELSLLVGRLEVFVGAARFAEGLSEQNIEELRRILADVKKHEGTTSWSSVAASVSEFEQMVKQGIPNCDAKGELEECIYGMKESAEALRDTPGIDGSKMLEERAERIGDLMSEVDDALEIVAEAEAAGARFAENVIKLASGETVDLDNIPPLVITYIPQHIARGYFILPVAGDDRQVIAISSEQAMDVEARSSVAMATGKQLQVVDNKVDGVLFQELLDKYYPTRFAEAQDTVANRVVASRRGRPIHMRSDNEREAEITKSREEFERAGISYAPQSTTQSVAMVVDLSALGSKALGVWAEQIPKDKDLPAVFIANTLKDETVKLLRRQGKTVLSIDGDIANLPRVMNRAIARLKLLAGANAKVTLCTLREDLVPFGKLNNIAIIQPEDRTHASVVGSITLMLRAMEIRAENETALEQAIDALANAVGA